MVGLIAGFLLIALFAGLAGFGGLAGEGEGLAQLLFVGTASVSTGLLLLRVLRWRVPPS